MSMPKTVRHINEKRALSALLREGSLSRADLARRLGLTRSTASSIASGLIREGLVRETGSAEDEASSRIGRPGTRMVPDGTYGAFLGVDLGVSRLHLLAIDFAGTRIAEASEAMDAAALGPEGTMARLAERIASFRAEIDPALPLRGLCLSVPGVVAEDGVVVRLPVLGWRNWPALALLRAAFPEIGDIAVENDANAFAFAEGEPEGGGRTARIVHLLLDEGVGGAILEGGVLQRGARGFAGEIGHMPVGDGGFWRGAALPGSLESFVGRSAILSRYAEGGGAFDLGALLGALGRGETPALAALDGWSHYLGRGLASITALLDPDEIVLGGPLAVLFERGGVRVGEALARHLMADHPLSRLRLSRLGTEGAALGGALLLRHRLVSVDEDFVFGRQPVADQAGSASIR